MGDWYDDRGHASASGSPQASPSRACSPASASASPRRCSARSSSASSPACSSTAGSGAAGGIVGAVIGSVSAAAVVRGAGAPRRDGRRDGAPPHRCCRRRRPARPDPGRRVHRGSRASRPRRAARPPEPGEVRRAPLAREVSAAPADPRRHRRPHPVDARGGDRLGRHARPRGARGARRLRARDLGLPVADAGLPLLDRDRRPRRRARDPAPRLVRPARGAASSSTAARSARSAPPGSARHLRDTLVNMNAQHLGARAVTLFEALADAGLRTAAVNFTAYRGRTRHRSSVPFLGDVLGPERFFFYNLFSSDRTGAPLSWRNRPAGSIDAYAAAVGRWLVTRDAFDFLVFYLSDYDYASHEHGPDTALEALRRCDDAIGALAEAGGGLDAFLERYAVVVMSDHGQTHVREAVSLARGLRRRRGRPAARRRTAPRTSTSSPAAGSTPRAVAARLDARAGRGGRAVPRGRRSGRAPRRGGARVRPGRGWRLRALAATPRSWTTPTRYAAPGRRSRTRTPARCSSRPPRATSSPISAAGTTSAAARTARSSPATPRCRSSRSASTAHGRRASSTSLRSCSRISASRRPPMRLAEPRPHASRYPRPT